MKVIIVARHNFYTPWVYYYKAVSRRDQVLACGPGQVIPNLNQALQEHPDTECMLIFTTGYFPDLSFPRQLGVPTVYMVLNTYVQWEKHLDYLKQADYIMVPQLQAAKMWQDLHPRVFWLPYAVDPEIYREHPVPRQYDMVFVGTVKGALYRRRRHLLNLLSQHFSIKIAENCYFQDAARLYSQGHMIFNESLALEVNMRTFEAMACRRCLITSLIDDAGFGILFADGEDLVIYGERDLLPLVDYYLSFPGQREKVASSGYGKVLKNHTYEHRWLFIKGLLEGKEDLSDCGFDAHTQ